MSSRSSVRLALVGWPVAHSFSPAMQRAGLAALGRVGSYDAIPITAEDFAPTIGRLADEGFRGCNITAPHKEMALALCEPDEEARRVGAVNTLLFEGDRVVGSNTDAHGFRMLLDEAGIGPRGRRATVLGAGGAARAIARVLLSAGAYLTVATRSQRRVVLGGHPEILHVPWDPSILDGVLRRTDLLIDATPRGLHPEWGASISVEHMPRGAAAIDLTVGIETPLLATARLHGLDAIGGAPMLLHQGAAALALWTGSLPPIEAMRAALYGQFIQVK